MLGYRSSDAVLTICQNNVAKSIEIIGINDAAASMTGYVASDIAGRALVDVIPSRIAGLLSEYVEYEPDANDVGMVLSKVQSFSLLSKDGKEHAYRLKVVRGESTQQRIEFRLVLQDKHGMLKEDMERKALEDNFRGHQVLDPALEMPDRKSLSKDIELANLHCNKSSLRACFAVMQLDHAEQFEHEYGADTVTQALKHIATLCRNSLRPYDVVGRVGTYRVGVLLLETSPESARMVLNRLRWQIASNPFELPNESTLVLSVSIAFGRIGGRPSDVTVMGNCEGYLNGLPSDNANSLNEVESSKKNA